MDSRARVLVLADQPGWAWATKAEQYRRWLSEEFRVTVGYRAYYYRPQDPLDWGAYDLVHTFEFPQVDTVPPDEYRGRLVTGLTALVWRTWGDERCARWAARADALHGNSPAIVEAIRPFHQRLYYLPNGVDPAFWRRTRPRRWDRLTAAHVGKPKEHKGYPLVGQVCAQVEVPVLTAYRTVHNALSPEAVRELYLDSHVYLVYSVKDGTPCCALEAAACGNLLLANDIGNMAEVCRAGAGVLIERTPEALAGALLALRETPLGEVIARGAVARRVIEEGWTWERQTERVAAMWRAVLA